MLAQQLGQLNCFEGDLKDVSTLQSSSVFMSSGTAVGSTDNTIQYTWCSIYAAVVKTTAIGKIVAEVEISRETLQLRLWAPASQQSQATEASVSLKGI